MAIDNELKVRLLHVAKTQNQWTAVASTYPKRGEVCLEAINTSGSTAFKIKIGDGSRPYCRNTGTSQAPVWDFTSEYVLPYFGTVITAGNTLQVLQYYTYPTDSSESGYDSTLAGKTVFRIHQLSIVETAGETVISVDTTNYKEIRPGSNIDFAADSQNLTISVPDGSVSQKGAVQLLNSYTESNKNNTTNATTNAAITSAIENLNSTATTSNTEDSKDVIVTVTESNGIVSSTKKTVTEGDKITISTPTTGADAGKMIISHEESNTVVTDNSSNKNERETNIITDVTVDDYGHVTAYTKDKSTNLIAADIRASVTKTDDTTWNYRETGGEISIGEDIARVSKLKGNTIVWNQNVENGDFSNGDSGWSGITGVSSGIATKIVTSTGSSVSGPIIQTKQYTINHKYLFIATVKSNNSATRIILAPTGTSSDGSTEYTYYGDWTTIRYIWTGVEREGSKLNIRGNNSLDPNTDVNFSIKNVMCLDLTKMFGSDNNICTSLGVADLIDNQGNLTIDTTKLNTAIANFEKLFPNPYYYYNAGELVSLGGYSESFNVWDEEWEQGGFSTSGGEISGTSRIRSKNYIPVISDKNYYFSIPNSDFRVIYYDSNLSVLGTKYISASGIISPDNFSNTAYLRFGTTDAYGGTYNNDICVNISNAAYNGLYLPYGEPLPFGVKSTGFNQWDEIGEIGNITSTTGEDTYSTSGTNWRSVNYIPVIPGATYYCKSDVSIFSRMYDSNKEFVPEGNLSIKNSTFDIPLNVYYLRFVTGALPQQPICINISDTKRNGTYEPYKKDTLDLDWVRNEGVENFNIWDEEWELGVLNSSTGQVNYSTISIVSKNFIPVLPNTAYYIKSPTTDFNRMTYYDINKQYLGSTAGGWDNFNEGIHTTPNNAYYCRFCVRTVTYNNDICINLSNPALNGEYHPHGAKAKYFPYGLLSAGSVYDEVGENYAIKRVGVVDLGELTWTYQEQYSRWACTFRLTPMGTLNLISAKYKTVSANTIPTNPMSIGVSATSSVLFGNTDSNTISPSGMLYYELATPVVVYFDEKKKLNYPVTDKGTEQQLPVNGSSVITSPFVGTFEYKSNFKDAVIDLINKTNAYKNPVKSKDNVSQTVGKFATYDTSYTVHSSEYQVKNNPFEGAETNITLPTAEQIIEYINTQIASSLTYKGVVSGLTGSTSGKIYFSGISNPSSGDLYFLGNLDSPATSMTVDATASSTYHIAEGTYYPGTMFIWNADTVGSEHWDAIAGTTTVSDNDPILWVDTATPDSSGHKQYTVGSIEGHDLHITVPTIEEIAGKKAAGQVLVGNGTGESDATATWRGLKLDETVDNSSTPAKISTLGTGILERYDNGSGDNHDYQWRLTDFPDNFDANQKLGSSQEVITNDTTVTEVPHIYKSENIELKKVKNSSNTVIGFSTYVPLLSSSNTSATAGKVLVGNYNASSETHTTPPSWENLKLDDTYEITNLGNGDSKVGYLKRKVTSGTGVTPVTYGWELDPYGGGSLKPSYADNTAVTASEDMSPQPPALNAGLREQIGESSYKHYKIPFSAIIDDSSTGNNAVTIILDGNFS